MRRSIIGAMLHRADSIFDRVAGKVVRRAPLAWVLLVWVGIAQAQIADPVPGPIPVGAASVGVEFVAVMPDSGPGGQPAARPMTLVDDGTGRRFIADQNGVVLQLHGDGSFSVFLDLRSMPSFLADQGQIGLQSIAFHPDYHSVGAAGEGRFYTSSSHASGSGTPDFPVPAGAPTNHHSVVHEWQVSVDPDVIDSGSEREVIRVGQTYTDHNLQQLAFDPNHEPGHPDRGLLFIGLGDGGNNGCCSWPSVDPHFVGQSLANPLGSILRIDPLAPAGGGAEYSVPTSNPYATDGDPSTLAEIYLHGLRNPHRFSWDRGGAGDLFISDIGQANIEEINRGVLGGNYGWSAREGTFLVEHFNDDDVFALPVDDALNGYLYPVIQYDHDEGDRAISGGYVVRGNSLPGLQGRYVFGDLTSGRLFHVSSLALGGSGQAAFEVLRLIDVADGQEKSLLEFIGGGPAAPRADLRFGWAANEIYLLTKWDATVRKLVAPPVAVPVLSGWGIVALLGALMSSAAGVMSMSIRRHGERG